VVHVLFMLVIYIYACTCPTQFPYQIIFVLFNSNTTCAIRGGKGQILVGLVLFNL